MTDTHCIRVAKKPAVISLPPKSNGNGPRTSVKDDLFHVNISWFAGIPGFYLCNVSVKKRAQRHSSFSLRKKIKNWCVSLKLLLSLDP